MSREKFEPIKKHFRSVAKREAYEHLVKLVKNADMKVRSNRLNIKVLVSQQITAKAELKALQSLLKEFK